MLTPGPHAGNLSQAGRQQNMLQRIAMHMETQAHRIAGADDAVTARILSDLSSEFLEINADQVLAMQKAIQDQFAEIPKSAGEGRGFVNVDAAAEVTAARIVGVIASDYARRTGRFKGSELPND